VSEPAEIQPSKLRSVIPWVHEIVVIGVVYVVYSFVRNQFGSATMAVGDEPKHAFNNAVDIIKLEKALGLFHEQTIQKWFLGTRWIIQFFNIFYGTAHFIVTLAILIWIFIRKRESFSLWRTTLMVTTVLALIGFALFPLMPPRLFNAYAHEPNCNEHAVSTSADVCYRYGGGELADGHQPNYHFVDTLRTVGGLWSFDSKKLDAVSNQYAAMPSLHIGWSTWCTIVLLTFTKRKWAKALAIAYPILTLTVIVATANHYIIDAVGGWVILGAGYLIARWFEGVRARRHALQTAEASDEVLIEDTVGIEVVTR
jgi:PAP2 superfamily